MLRIGQSSDIHMFVKGRKLVLGGVEIPYELGLKGHSDADALLHAVAESIIGALALGDLGKHFPDTDAQFKDMDSLWMLRQVHTMMRKEGYVVHNLDALILIEKPKMAPHIDAMKRNIADALHCQSNQVNVKATRGETLGYIGRGEGVMAQCVTLLRQSDDETM